MNVFLGVRNLNESFLPEHLRYLHSYFRSRPINALFPSAVLASTAAAAMVWRVALDPLTGAFDATAAPALPRPC